MSLKISAGYFLPLITQRAYWSRISPSMNSDLFRVISSSIRLASGETLTLIAAVRPVSGLPFLFISHQVKNCIQRPSFHVNFTQPV